MWGLWSGPLAYLVVARRVSVLRAIEFDTPNLMVGDALRRVAGRGLPEVDCGQVFTVGRRAVTARKGRHVAAPSIEAPWV